MFLDITHTPYPLSFLESKKMLVGITREVGILDSMVLWTYEGPPLGHVTQPNQTILFDSPLEWTSCVLVKHDGFVKSRKFWIGTVLASGSTFCVSEWTSQTDLRT